MSAAPTVDFELVLRSRVTIAALAERVWRELGRLQAWKASVVSVERLAGEPDAVGETLRVGQRPQNATVYTLMRTLRCEPFAWKLQTLQTEDGQATDGYVSYELDAEGGTTRLSCLVVARCRVPLPPGVASAAEFAAHANAATLAKLDADHAVLKRLVETGHT